MYEILTRISNTLSLPFYNMVDSLMDFPILVALILGLIGSLAPCQLTTNISAITIYGTSSIQSKMKWTEVLFFIAGKIIAFSLLGLLFWWIGNDFRSNSTIFFSAFRKVIGPMIIFIGLFLLGFFKLRFINKLSSWIPITFKEGKWGSLWMGISFSVAFCPTMFILFFVTLMPVAISSPSGFILPSLFGIATSIPLLIILFMISFLELDGSLIKKSRKVGSLVQKFSGVALVILGVFDTLTYWSL
jgi:cytochrome c-type biogenesis protein|nr:sulfite exporter TauE/SafE family protein [Rossellomorea aquimaris]